MAWTPVPATSNSGDWLLFYTAVRDLASFVFPRASPAPVCACQCDSADPPAGPLSGECAALERLVEKALAQGSRVDAPGALSIEFSLSFVILLSLSLFLLGLILGWILRACTQPRPTEASVGVAREPAPVVGTPLGKPILPRGGGKGVFTTA